LNIRTTFLSGKILRDSGAPALRQVNNDNELRKCPANLDKPHIVYVLFAMLSQKARYALHALIVLAEHGDDTPMMIAEIADEAGVPRKFLEQILLELRKRGILRSLRGRMGGYMLGKAPKDISFADIIRTIDGPLALAPCVSVTAYHRCEDCVDEKTCAIRKVLLLARDATAEILESQTLAGAISRRKRGSPSLK
jgi:Rrf2 family protein